MGCNTKRGLITAATKLPAIILKNERPRIEIYFESINSFFELGVDDRTTIIIKNQPRIRISYEEPSDI